MENLKGFLFAGISSCTATATIQPIDTIKVKIQIASEAKGDIKITNLVKKTFLKEGVKGFYRGLDSALLRQATYGTSRIGFYKYFYGIIENYNNGVVPFFQKIGCSMSSAILGVFIGNPFDVALVRFQCDSSLPVEKRRNYKNAIDAIRRIAIEEGYRSLWNGVLPSIYRAMAMNCGQLVTFDEVKEISKNIRKKDDNINRLIASAAAGITCSLCALPLDNVKTKLQKMIKLENGKYEYNGFTDCFSKTIKNEGVSRLWIGLPAFYLRCAPHAMITLLINDYLTRNYKKSK